MEEKQFVIQAYSKAELAAWYKQKPKQFKIWVKRAKLFDWEEYSKLKILTPAYVKKIVEHLGEP